MGDCILGLSFGLIAINFPFFIYFSFRILQVDIKNCVKRTIKARTVNTLYMYEQFVAASWDKEAGSFLLLCLLFVNFLSYKGNFVSLSLELF